MRDDNLLENVRRRGDTLRQGLRAALGSHPNVGDIRGRGFFIGVEFVENRAQKTPFEPELKIHNCVQSGAMNNGLLCYGMGGTIDGRRGDHVLLAPPYTLDDDQELELIEKFVRTVEERLHS